MYPYGSRGYKSKMGLIELKPRCQQSYILLETPGEPLPDCSAFCLFWPLALFVSLQANNIKPSSSHATISLPLNFLTSSTYKDPYDYIVLLRYIKAISKIADEQL